MAENDNRLLIENHYDVIGVARSASEQEVREAEMSMRKVYEHRAHLGDAAATDMLRRLNEASAVLLDVSRRAQYDRENWTIAMSFRDIAHTPSLVRGERLADLRSWSTEERDIVRGATLLAAPDLRSLLSRHRLLGDQ
jgi:curved DNA-binding protein CbpA